MSLKNRIIELGLKVVIENILISQKGCVQFVFSVTLLNNEYQLKPVVLKEDFEGDLYAESSEEDMEVIREYIGSKAKIEKVFKAFFEAIRPDIENVLVDHFKNSTRH